MTSTAAKRDDPAGCAGSRLDVHAPDTPTFTWGQVKGPVETVADVFVVARLEQALGEGRLRRGGSGWRAAAAELCDRALDEPIDALGLQFDDGGADPPDAAGPGRGAPAAHTIRQLIVLERVIAWVRSPGHPALLANKMAAAPLFVLPLPPMPDATRTEPLLAPMQWLLDACDPAVTLTSSQYLPRSLVIEAAERFGWHPRDKRLRSEVSIPQLVLLRDIAVRLGYLHRTGTMLAATREGHLMIDDVRGLWRGMCRSLGLLDPFTDSVATAVGLRLLQGPMLGADRDDEIVAQIGAIGWQSGGRPLDGHTIRGGIHTVLYWWRTNGLLEEHGPTSVDHLWTGDFSTALTPLGRAVVLTSLHAQATSPSPAS